MDHLRGARRRPSVAAPAEHFAELTSDHDTAAEALDSVATGDAVALIAQLPRAQRDPSPRSTDRPDGDRPGEQDGGPTGDRDPKPESTTSARPETSR